MKPDPTIEHPASSIEHPASSIETSIYQITPYLLNGCRLPDPNFNNGTNWLREAINIVYNRNKGRLKATGVETNLFHNHNEQSGQNIARYPLIQYQKNEQGYFVVGINEGCRALDELFCEALPSYTINTELQIRVQNIAGAKNLIKCSKNSYNYSLINWLPFSNQNYRQFKSIASLTDKLLFLERTLKNHVVKDFSKHLDLGLTDEQVVLQLTTIDSFTNSTVRLKVNKHIHDFQPFTVGFTSNVLLPNHICLGNGKVYGFGLLKD